MFYIIQFGSAIPGHIAGRIKASVTEEPDTPPTPVAEIQ
jgi:hypothetical protein